MADNSVLQRQLDESYAKLNALQAASGIVPAINNVVPITPAVATPTAVTPPVDVEALITKLIEEKLTGLLASTPTPEPVKEITILDALGNILTGAELKWLQDEKVISRIPHFVLTAEGQEITKSFFSAFRKEYEK
jgi:hypothetical protein